MTTFAIIVAAHRPYTMPRDDIYIPLHVGKNGGADIGFAGDDTGDNISYKNPNYCELTGLYWAWKNLYTDYLGLVHYRRHFCYEKKGGKWDSILTEEELGKLLAGTDMLLPKKRKYYIETIGSHYAHTFDRTHLEITRAVIIDMCPEYLSSFDKVMRRRSAHMFNMFIMKREYFDAYCLWLFSILEELERRVDLSSMTAFEARLFGRVSEILLDVWIDRNKIRYREVEYMYMEKINWFRKGGAFLMAKFGNKKYEGSF